MNCKNKLRIAVIDTRINDEYFHNDSNIEVVNSDAVECNEQVSHGTVCCKLIRKFCPEARIFNYVILNNNKGKVESLYTALKWCIANNISAISLSLGTTYIEDVVADAAIYTELYEKGIIVLSAQSNSGYTTFPAAFPTVISVEENRSALTDQICIHRALATTRCTNLVANGKHTIQLTDSIEYTTPGSNSYATAFATAYIAANILDNSDNIEKVINHFSINTLPFTFHSLLISSNITVYVDLELNYIYEQEIMESLPVKKVIHLKCTDESYDTLLKENSGIIFLSNNTKILKSVDTIAPNINSLICLNVNDLKESFAYSHATNSVWNFVFCNSIFEKYNQICSGIPIVAVIGIVRQPVCSIRYALHKAFRTDSFVLSGYSNMAIDICCGYDYIDDVFQEKDYYTYLFTIKRYDIMLNSYEFKDYCQMSTYIKSSQADLLICVYETHIELLSANIKHAIAVHYSDDTVAKIYQYILSDFDTNC